MMNIIDTHTHLYLPEFEEDRDEVLARAIDAGVTRMILPNVDLATIAPLKELHSSYPDNTSMAMGLHPTEINREWKENLAKVMSELDADDYVAVGEIGMDLYWDKTFVNEQMEVLSLQVRRAVEKGLPVIIHCREALDRTIEVLQDYSGKVKGVFHSFGGDAEDVEKIRGVGDFYFGINGVVTFKNSRLRETLPEIGIDRILLETDAPYLAPVPFRGKRNESSYIVNTASTVAAALGITVEDIAQKTSTNAENLFHFME